MEKILVRWSDGKSKGTTSLVRKSAVKKGTIVVGEKVVVSWGKSKKNFNAEVIDVNGAQAPASPATTRNEPEEQFTFELAAPAPSTSTDSRAPEGQQDDRFYTILQKLESLSEKLDSLSDTVSGVEARLVCRLRTLEEKVYTLQPPVSQYPLLLETPMRAPPMEMATPVPPYFWQEIPPTQLESPHDMPLQDITSRMNVGDVCIPPEDISSALQACRSHRNLAARLAVRMFPPRERVGSNCRGVLGKKALNGPKIKAIYAACMQHFPLQRLESATTSEKEMSCAIDEVCRKTKPPEEIENC